MNKALRAVAGVALLATASAVAVYVASPGGEEELVQQLATVTATPGSPTPSDGASVTPSPAASATPAPSLTPSPAPGALPICPTSDARTFTYQPVPGGETKEHTDDARGYSVRYPAEWTICQVAFSPQIPDFFAAVEIYDSGLLLRASVYIRGNPKNLTLEEWIRARDAFFYENPPEERLISGTRALVAPLNFEGRPSPLAYLRHGEFVISIKGLKTEDFELIAAGFGLR